MDGGFYVRKLTFMLDDRAKLILKYESNSVVTKSMR